MTEPFAGAAPRSIIARWQQIFPGAGPPDAPATALESTAGHKWEIPELFVRADPAERRSLDLLCVALIGCRPADDDTPDVRLVVLGPQQLRAQSAPSLTGLTVLDVALGGGQAGASWISIGLLRMRRRARISQITGSISELGRVLDYRHDPLGSHAVAHAVCARLTILTATTGVRVSVTGSVDLTATPGDDRDAYFVLPARDPARSGNPGPQPEPLRRADRLPPAIRENDFITLRFGKPRARRTKVRSVLDLRREHALVEIGASLDDLPQDESYAVRITRVRQDARAKAIMLAAADGEDRSAVAVCRAALAVPQGWDAFRDGLASRITTVGDFWHVDDVLAAAIADPSAAAPAGPVPAAALAVRVGLDGRLDQLLGLRPSRLSKDQLMAVTPVVLEVADDLVPHVDSSQDEGRFLDGLIPAMRDRIKAETGVTVPGVRVRGDPALPPGGFRILIDEVPALTGQTPAEAEYVVHACEAAPRDDEQPTPIHPVTGAPGAWVIRRAEPAGTEETFAAPHYLIHQLTLILRARLTELFGPQELGTLVGEWVAEDEQGLVPAILPDQIARLRLTWILQALMADGLPIKDWRAILSAIRAAGGTTVDLPRLRRAARRALRAQLPGRQDDSRRHHLPAALESQLLAPPDAGAWDDTHQRHFHLLTWIRDTVVSFGPLITIVTSSEEAREMTAAAARNQHAFVTTLTDDELPQ